MLISAGRQKGILNEMNFKDLYRILERNKYYVFSHQDIMSFYPKEKKRQSQKDDLQMEKKWMDLSFKEGIIRTYPKCRKKI